MSHLLPRSIRSAADLRTDLSVRICKAACLRLTLLTMTACAAAPVVPSVSASAARSACYWLQSSGAGCHEIAEWSPRG